jgi:hypothetical protein
VRPTDRRTRRRRRGINAGAAVLIAAAACGPRPTPAPPFGGGGVDSATDSAVVAYGATLTFDSVAAHGDLATAPPPGGGPTDTLRIAPEIGAGELTHAQLVAGRITGRVVATAPYAALGIQSGTNYIWTDSSAKGWRDIFFSDQVRSPQQTTVFVSHEFARDSAARARFLFSGGTLAAVWHQGTFKGCVGSGALQASKLDSLVDSLHIAH